MSDRLVDFAANPTARKLVSTLGLPIPMPQTLERLRGPRPALPLADRRILVAGSGRLTSSLAELLPRWGATTVPVGLDPTPFAEHGAAWSRPPEPEATGDVHGIVFDATGLRTPADLKALYDALHPRVRSLKRCGRVVVIGRKIAGLKPVEAATQRALEGFTRSLAKELGRKGSTANLIHVADGAEERLAGPLRFFLTPTSVYVSGQKLLVSKTVRGFEDVVQRPLDGKVALVTGAARGIGAATARVLAAEGARVIVLDRPDDDGPASEVAHEIGGSLFLADVTDPETPDKLAAFVQETFGHLDIVIHNAGVTRDKTLAKMKPELWDLTLAVNLQAIVDLDAALTPLLRKGGRIVCLSSIAGIGGNVGQTNYAASKAGVIGYVQASAPVLARRGIAINAIAPGFIETRLTDAIPVATREGARRLCNLSQGGQPEDVAQALCFFSSPGAGGLCGQVMRVCGGNLMGA